MNNKKSFTDKRWWEWPTEGITTRGHAPKKVQKDIDEWLKLQENKGDKNG